MPSSNVKSATPSPDTKPRRETSKRSSRKGIPADIVFYVVGFISLICMGVVLLLGKAMVFVGAIGMLLCVWVLYENDRRGFSRSSEMRRAYEPRRKFSAFEVLVLVLIIMGNALVSAYVLIT